jgi:hypothetical protein
MINFLGFLSKSDFSQAIRSLLLWPNWKGEWILGRHACLGRDVIKLTNIQYPIFNIQKGRVDHFTNSVKQINKRTRTVDIGRFLSRRDVIPFLRQQEYCHRLPQKSPKFVYMDSYSELVDHYFQKKGEDWGACCCYSDINHSVQFKEQFNEMGLLEINNLEYAYRDFFNQIREQYGEVPIVFLHFPMCLETREKYLKRGKAIFEIIESLTLEYEALYSISIDEEMVSKPIEVAPELENFPYHYNDEAYVAFSKVLKTLNLNMQPKSNADNKQKI